MSTISEMPEGEKNVFWVCGALRQLQIWGLIDGVLPKMTILGLAEWDQLDATMRIPDDDLLRIMSDITDGPLEHGSPQMILMRGFRDDRKKLEEIADGTEA